MAASMAGMEFETVDDVVKDAMGEICNMLAGTWKSKVPDLSANCGLSVPAVITGSDYNLHVQSP
jgi:chemotaxis protein CheX